MSKRGIILAAFAAVAMSTVSVHAADLGGMKGGSMKDGSYMPAIQQQSIASGMYLRGDVSFGQNNFSSLYEPPAYTLSDTRIERSRSWGVGIGRYFSDNIRGDITVDLRGNAGITGFVNDGLATVQGERVFGVKSTVALANLYYDFGSRSRFTPYIGVGLGFARNTTSAGHVNIAHRPTDPCVDPLVATCEATFAGATKTNAAGALMAGFSAKLHDRLHLDAGYRFLYLGGAHTGDIVTRSTVVATGAVTNGGASDPIVHDLHAHEFRVGIRWDINR